MPLFENTEQLHAVARRMLQRLKTENPSATRALYGSRLLIRLRTKKPAGEIWLDARRRPLHTTFGPARMHPHLQIDLDADTLHRILLGEVSLLQALGKGELQVRGPAWKMTSLAQLFHYGQEVYPQILREHGLAA